MNQGAPEQDEEQAGSFSLDRAISAVRRKLKFIAVCTGLATGLAVAVVMVIPNRYDATSTIQIDPRKKSISNMDSVLSDLRADASTVESEVEVIKSSSILLKVIDALNLRNDAEFSKPTPIAEYLKALAGAAPTTALPSGADNPDRVANPNRMENLMGSKDPAADRPQRDPVLSALLDRLKVARVRTTLLIEIKISARDPVKAARIANAVAEFYLQDQLESKKQAAGFASGVLETKLDELRAKLTEAERRVEEFKADNNIFDSEGQILSERQLTRHMEQTVLARNAATEARAKYEQAKKLFASGKGSSSTTDVLSSNTVRLMKEALARATQRQAELLTKYGPKHPEMLKVNAEVADAEGQLNGEIGRLVESLKTDYEIAEDRERQLADSFSGLKDGQISAKEASVRLNELQREAMTQKQLFEALLTRFKQTAETQDLQLPDSRIVEHAAVPMFPAAPKRKQLVALAVVAGLMMAILLVLVLEFGTSGVVRGEDVEREFALTHLGSVPLVSATDIMTCDPMRSIRMMLAEPRSNFADTIRAARREIDAKSRGRSARVVMIASSLPNEGTNVIASNLAHHYAMTGTRVLLIDGDLRRSTLTRQLAASRQAGLLDVLVQGLPLEQAILRDAATGLYFMPAISQVPLELSSPEILGSWHMRSILTHLKRDFDTIIIDTPPLLPVMDGRLLADHADEIVFVMTWRRTPKQLARKALRTLGHNQQKIAGVIINQVDPQILAESQGFGLPAQRRSAA
jgi:polysaccharide biosynthesis transport protein